jgi:hypothetical protein
MKIASYKGTRSGIKGVFNVLVRFWRATQYSHSELVFSDGMSGSCSKTDGGLRLKKIEYDLAKWDVIEIEGNEQAAREFFEKGIRGGAKADTHYSLALLFSFVFCWVGKWASKRGHVCSTAIAKALGIHDWWRVAPEILPLVVRKKE